MALCNFGGERICKMGVFQRGMPLNILQNCLRVAVQFRLIVDGDHRNLDGNRDPERKDLGKASGGIEIENDAKGC